MMRTRTWGGVLAVGAAALLMAGCASGADGVAGSWGSDAPGEPMLLLGADGSLSGTDGCNRLMGSWEQGDDGKVEFGQVASTLMACTGVDTWLSGLATGEVQGQQLHIFDASGAEIGTLSREQAAELR